MLELTAGKALNRPRGSSRPPGSIRRGCQGAGPVLSLHAAKACPALACLELTVQARGRRQQLTVSSDGGAVDRQRLRDQHDTIEALKSDQCGPKPSPPAPGPVASQIMAKGQKLSDTVSQCVMSNPTHLARLSAPRGHLSPPLDVKTCLVALWFL